MTYSAASHYNFLLLAFCSRKLVTASYMRFNESSGQCQRNLETPFVTLTLSYRPLGLYGMLRCQVTPPRPTLRDYLSVQPFKII